MGFAVLREFAGYEFVVVKVVRVMRVVVVSGINVVVAKATLSTDSGVRGQIGSAVRAGCPIVGFGRRHSDYLILDEKR